MLVQIAYYTIFSIPVIVYLGVITLLSFLFTAMIPVAKYKGRAVVPFKWHKRMAYFSIILAILHGILAVASYL